MEQPKWFIAPRQGKKMCKLVKSLYGLKQAPKRWHEKFDNIMMSNDFKINECDKCAYAKSTLNGYVIVCLYMDDMLIFGSNNNLIVRNPGLLYSHALNHVRCLQMYPKFSKSIVMDRQIGIIKNHRKHRSRE